MIPVKPDVSIEGSLGGQVHSLSVDASNIPHLMRVLTDLYSDNELAFLREYSTNAYDSHVMAGVDKPIEVSTPNAFRQTFEVQDYGLGLSVDEIVTIYGSYGASTKRDDNGVNGCLGLGSKSALTYTSMFTVRAVKNGVKAEVAIYRDATNGGNIEVVDTCATDEPNGVRVIVPTNVDSSFEYKVKNFYRYWPTGSVLIDGEPNVNVADDPDTKSFWLNDKTLIISNDDYEMGHRVVMGNVAYPVNLNLSRNYNERYIVVYFADMGEVEFVPSREALNLTPAVQQVIRDIEVSAARPKILKYFQDQPTTTMAEAVTVFTEAHKYLSHVNITYPGGELKQVYDIRGRRYYPKQKRVRTKAYYSVNVNQLYLQDSDKYVFIAGKYDVSMTPNNRLRISKALTEKDMEKQIIIVGDRSVIPDAFSACPVYDWDSIKAIDVPKAAKAARSSTPAKKIPEYDYVSKTGMAYGVLPQGTYYKTDSVGSLSWWRQFLREDEYVVAVPSPRKAKFDRLYVSSDPDFLKQRAIGELKSLTSEEMLVHDMWYTKSKALAKFVDKFDDPALDSLTKACARHAEISAIVSEYRKLGVNTPRAQREWIDQKYPLINWNYPEHTVKYVNYIYQENK